MTVLQTIAVAFAMFSALPVPQFEWNEKNMRYAMCAFPLIGLVCGGLWCLCGVLPLPELARAAAFCLVPVAVTGGIHLDGYADTSDALSSYGDREKKLEILKDSHCGAFAVIRLCCYFAAYFGLCGSVRFTPRAGLCWTLALVLERALSGFAVAAFPLAKDTGLAHTFATAADKQTVRRFLCGLSALLILALTALGGGGLAAAALLALWRYDSVAKKQFGGITGDLAGWFLQRAELWMLAALAVSQWGGVLYMMFITGPLYSGKRTFARNFRGSVIADVQDAAAETQTPEQLETLARELAEYDIVIATEVGGGVVPMDAEERAGREAAGRLACLLAERADCVVQMFCGIPTVLKGELPQC